MRLGLHVVAADLDRAGGGLQQADDHLDGRGLPGAVGAQEAKDLAAVDFEADIVDGQFVAVFFDQVAGLDHRDWTGHSENLSEDGDSAKWRLGNW